MGGRLFAHCDHGRFGHFKLTGRDVISRHEALQAVGAVSREELQCLVAAESFGGAPTGARSTPLWRMAIVERRTSVFRYSARVSRIALGELHRLALQRVPRIRGVERHQHPPCLDPVCFVRVYGQNRARYQVRGHDNVPVRIGIVSRDRVAGSEIIRGPSVPGGKQHQRGDPDEAPTARALPRRFPRCPSRAGSGSNRCAGHAHRSAHA